MEQIAENEKTYGDKLIEKLKDPNENTYASLFTDCQTALDIAEILAGKEDDGAEIREFTKVTGKFILENNRIRIRILYSNRCKSKYRRWCI